MPISIRRLDKSDALLYWQTRNHALQTFPDAFTTSVEEGIATAPDTLAKRFGGGGSDNFVLGAFADETLVGFAGLERETRAKQRHKAKVIGMYVAPAAQGGGVGGKLLEALIAEARRLTGLEQLLLTVTRGNASAERLYLRTGFVPFGTEKNALKIEGIYYDKVYMALVL